MSLCLNELRRWFSIHYGWNRHHYQGVVAIFRTIILQTIRYTVMYKSKIFSQSNLNYNSYDDTWYAKYHHVIHLNVNSYVYPQIYASCSLLEDGLFCPQCCAGQTGCLPIPVEISDLAHVRHNGMDNDIFYSKLHLISSSLRIAVGLTFHKEFDFMIQIL